MNHVNSYISPLQHGFVKGRSVETNLCMFTQFVTENIDAGTQVDTIYIDFSKAFDRLDHYKLLDKLSSFGFSDNLIIFFATYLTGRKQRVMCSGYESVEINVTSGVPQGSVLGPLFFNLL